MLISRLISWNPILIQLGLLSSQVQDTNNYLSVIFQGVITDFSTSAYQIELVKNPLS